MLDLKKLEKKLDEALASETPDSLNKWLDQKIQEEKINEFRENVSHLFSSSFAYNYLMPLYISCKSSFFVDLDVNLQKSIALFDCVDKINPIINPAPDLIGFTIGEIRSNFHIMCEEEDDENIEQGIVIDDNIHLYKRAS